MPSLRDLLDLAASEIGLDAETLARIESEIRAKWGNTRVHIPPLVSRKDPRRVERIRELASNLPTAVVAERLSVSTATVYRAVRRPIR